MWSINVSYYIQSMQTDYVNFFKPHRLCTKLLIFKIYDTTQLELRKSLIIHTEEGFCFLYENGKNFYICVCVYTCIDVYYMYVNFKYVCKKTINK